MKKFGSGLFVTAAFIGPGTVTTASIAGANFGYALVWALLFSVVATYVLQEMASRLGIATGAGLAEALRSELPSGWMRLLGVALIVCAIGAGNAAYQAGNLTGAAMGIAQAVGGAITAWSVVIGVLAAGLLYSGKHKLIETSLITLVVMMSLVFMFTAVMADPDWQALLAGVLAFSMPDGATLTVIALIGTTVVPYNLFLHASIVAKQHNTADMHTTLRANRMDAGLSIGFGGLITLAVLSCAATSFFATGTSLDTSNIAQQLEPVLGAFAGYFFAVGLFAAGLTSAITAPLAAAYALSGALGWPNDLRSSHFRLIWMLVMASGVIFASLGFKPLSAILFAQATNGLLLPIVACFLLWIMNRGDLLGDERNSWLNNLIGALIVLFVSALGIYRLLGAV